MRSCSVATKLFSAMPIWFWHDKFGEMGMEIMVLFSVSGIGRTLHTGNSLLSYSGIFIPSIEGIYVCLSMPFWWIIMESGRNAFSSIMT